MLTAILLAGGFGTRVKALYPDLPKPMIPVAGEPFLEWALRYWAREGVTRFIISLGHLAEVAETWLAARPAGSIEVRSIVEREPLGTAGGALLAAAAVPGADPLIVANADSLVIADTRPALALLARPDVDAVLLGVRVPDAARYGTLVTNGDGRLTGFREKRPGVGVINAGVYFFRRRALDWFPPQRPLSFETDVFPALIARGAHLAVAASDAPFLDIGTPESLAAAETFIRTNLP